MKIEVTIDHYIGMQVQKARKKKKIKQDVLAHKLGFSHMNLSHKERGIRGWKVSELYEVAKILKLPIEYFIINQPISKE